MCIMAKLNHFFLKRDANGRKLVTSRFGTYKPTAVPLAMADRLVPQSVVNLTHSLVGDCKLFLLVPSCDKLDHNEAIIHKGLVSTLFRLKNGESCLISEWCN